MLVNCAQYMRKRSVVILVLFYKIFTFSIFYLPQKNKCYFLNNKSCLFFVSISVTYSFELLRREYKAVKIHFKIINVRYFTAVFFRYMNSWLTASCQVSHWSAAQMNSWLTDGHRLVAQKSRVNAAYCVRKMHTLNIVTYDKIASCQVWTCLYILFHAGNVVIIHSNISSSVYSARCI